MNKNDIEKYMTKSVYQHKDMKKYLPTIKDEQVKLTGIPVNSHVLICGGTGSQKSDTLVDFLSKSMSQTKKPTFSTIHVLIKKFEPINYFLKEKLEDYIKFYTKIEDFPSVDSFKDLSTKNDDLQLIVFDDFITEKNKQFKKKIEDYLIYGRSKGCTVFLLTQSYYQTDILLRKQVSFVILCGIKSNRDLNAILNEYSMGGVDFKTLVKMYNYAKESINGEPTFLKSIPIYVQLIKSFLNIGYYT